MSERKTAEIKFRCTPSFKSNLQAAAEAAGQSMSEYIEAAVWSLTNVQLDSISSVENAISQLRAEGAGESGLAEYIRTNVVTTGPMNVEVLNRAVEAVVPKAECACKPWEFCTHKARA